MYKIVQNILQSTCFSKQSRTGPMQELYYCQRYTTNNPIYLSSYTLFDPTIHPEITYTLLAIESSMLFITPVQKQVNAIKGVIDTHPFYCNRNDTIHVKRVIYEPAKPSAKNQYSVALYHASIYVYRDLLPALTRYAKAPVYREDLLHVKLPQYILNPIHTTAQNTGIRILVYLYELYSIHYLVGWYIQESSINHRNFIKVNSYTAAIPLGNVHLIATQGVYTTIITLSILQFFPYNK